MQSVSRLEAKFGRKNLRFGEAPAQQARIALQVLFQNVDTATMKSHTRCVGPREPVLRENLQARVLAICSAPVRANYIETGVPYRDDSTLGLAPWPSSQFSTPGARHSQGAQIIG